MEKAYNVQEEMGNKSREMEEIKKILKLQS
jgi:hypothetical protein